VVAVFAGGTVGESEIVDVSISTGDVDQRIRDVAWRKLIVENRRAEVEADRSYRLRAVEIDHSESASLLLTDVYSQVKISEGAIDEYLVAVKKKHEATTLRIRHVFLRADASTPEDLRADQYAVARLVRRRALAGERFEVLVREFSDSADASTGGVVDNLRPGMADPAFERIVFSLPEGGISDVIETNSGYHIVRLERRYPPQSFDEGPYRESAPQVLRKQEEERLRSMLIDRLRKNENYERRWSASAGISPRAADGAVLEIGDFTFTTRDLAKARARSEPELQRWDQRAAFLEGLLDRELLHRESLRRGLATDEEIRDRSSRATEQALVEGALEREVAQAKQSIPRATLEDFVANPSSPLDLPATFRTNVIFVADGGSPYDSMTLAEELRERIRAGEEFSSVARLHSDGPNADRGGELGYLDRVGLFGYAPELARAAASLEVGGVSEPERITATRLVSTINALRGGFLIVELVDRQPPGRLDLDHDENEIRDRLWEQRGAELLAAHRDRMLAEAQFRRVR
jgi:parvulin-like peptidyl-prolyl isomerase